MLKRPGPSSLISKGFTLRNVETLTWTVDTGWTACNSAPVPSASWHDSLVINMQCEHDRTGFVEMLIWFTAHDTYKREWIRGLQNHLLLFTTTATSVLFWWLDLFNSSVRVLTLMRIRGIGESELESRGTKLNSFILLITPVLCPNVFCDRVCACCESSIKSLKTWTLELIAIHTDTE